MLGFLPRRTDVERRAARVAAPTRLSLAAKAAFVPQPEFGLAVPRIESAGTFDAISTPASDLVGNGRLAKFLIDRRDPAAPRLQFVNGNFTDGGQTPDAARYHYFFGQAALERSPRPLQEFNDVTYFTNDKRYVAGTVHSYFLADDPEPMYGIQFYPQDVIREDAVLGAVTPVQAQLQIPGAAGVRPTGTQQTTDAVSDRLAAAGIENLRWTGSWARSPTSRSTWAKPGDILRIFPRDNDELRSRPTSRCSTSCRSTSRSWPACSPAPCRTPTRT